MTKDCFKCGGEEMGEGTFGGGKNWRRGSRKTEWVYRFRVARKIRNGEIQGMIWALLRSHVF